MIHIYASDSESHELVDRQPTVSIIPNSHNPDEFRIDMDQFTQSMPQNVIASPHSLTLAFNSSKDIAQYLTQIAHGDTIAQPTFLTGPVREHLKRIKTENPAKYERLLYQLIEHKSKATRSINITGATEALQKEITPEMVGLLVDAWQTSHTQQTGTITEQEQAARFARIKFWCTVGTTLLGIAGTVIAASFAGTGTC
jgi:hypothetical protein